MLTFPRLSGEEASGMIWIWVPHFDENSPTAGFMKRALFDAGICADDDASDFLASILEASTEYSIVAQDLDGKILLWNEGARRVYGWEAAEVVGKANVEV